MLQYQNTNFFREVNTASDPKSAVSWEPGWAGASCVRVGAASREHRYKNSSCTQATNQLHAQPCYIRTGNQTVSICTRRTWLRGAWLPGASLARVGRQPIGPLGELQRLPAYRPPPHVRGALGGASAPTAPPTAPPTQGER